DPVRLAGAVLLEPVKEIAATGADIEHSRTVEPNSGVSKRLQEGALDDLHVRDVAGVVPAIRACRRGVSRLVLGADALELSLGHEAKTSGSCSNASTARWCSETVPMSNHSASLRNAATFSPASKSRCTSSGNWQAPSEGKWASARSS